MPDWHFFNHAHPDEVRDQRTRKKIRAHVTRRQHALKRQITGQRPDLRPSKESAEDSRTSWPEQCSDESAADADALALRQRQLPGGEQCWALLKSPHRIPEELEDSAASHNLEPCRRLDNNARPRQGATSPFVTTVQLNTAPVPRREWYGWLHDYWFNGTLPKAVNLLKISNEQLQRYIAWMWRLQNSEPAMYYMSLLIATGIP